MNEKPVDNTKEMKSIIRPKKILVNQSLNESKALSELPKILPRAPKDISFLSEKNLRKTKSKNFNKIDRFAEFPGISNR